MNHLPSRIQTSVAAILLCCVANAQANDPKSVKVDIQQQSILGALKELGEQTGLQLLMRVDTVSTDGIVVQPVSGQLSVKAALDKLLANTGLTYEFVNDRTIRISRIADRPTTMNSDPASRGFRVATVADVVMTDASGGGRAESTTAPSSNNTKSETMQQVVVTAQKRDENLQDVPVPVTSVSADTLVANNQPRLQDFFSTIPGFNVSPSPGGAGQQMLVLRGVIAGAFTNPTVGVAIDDVPFGASTTYLGNVIPDVDPSELSRIEVLRGPQGTLYGASSMGGLVKFVTLDPSTKEFSGRVRMGLSSVSHGSDPGYGLNAAVNVPVSDQFAFRASGFARETPGYIDNSVLGEKDLNEQRVRGGLLSGLWQPSDAFSLKLSALYQDDEADGASQVTRGPGVGDLEQRFVANVGWHERRAQAYSATATANLGSVELTSVSGYNVNNFANAIEAGPGLALVVDDAQVDKFTQEIRAATSFGERVDWLVGAFYTHEKSVLPQVLSLVNPTTGDALSSLSDTTINFRYTEYSAFTDLTYHFTDRFNVQVGGRQSHIELNRLAQLSTGALFPPAGALTPAQYSKADAFTYLLTPQFKVSADLMLYARLASGYRAGGPNNALCTSFGTFPCQFRPDKTKNYEVGAKGDFAGGLLSFDASLYYIDWSDVQITLRDPVSTFNYGTNGSAAKSQGVELSVVLRPARGLAISSWATYTDAVLTEAFPTGSTARGADGDRLPFSARFSANLAADYEFPLTARMSGSVGTTANYVGERIGTFVGTPIRQVYPSYAQFDVRAGVRAGDWTANLYALNVADRRGSIGGGLGTFPATAFVYIQPRTLGISIARSF
jgi:outer membrane receptor protein involved in Fe transport